MAKNKVDIVPIRNLNVSLPEEFSKEGTLEKLHNLRYTENGIENVYDFKLEKEINNFNGFTIVYNHDNSLIAVKSDTIHHIDLELGKIVSKEILATNVPENELKINHFGNILIVTNSENQLHFLRKDDNYSLLRFDDILPPENIKIEYEFASSNDLNESLNTPILGYNSHDDINYEYSMAIDDLHGRDYIYGAFYLVFGYRLYDGSIIKNSKAYMIATEKSNGTVLELVKKVPSGMMQDGNEYKYTYYQKLSAAKPTITIPIDIDAINTELIHSIVIFSTRPEYIYDFKNYHTIFGSNEGLSVHNGYLDANLFLSEDCTEYIKRPMYEIEEINLANINNINEVRTTLSYSKHYENIEYNPVYEASFSAHNIYHGNLFEYNGMLHTFNQRTKFFQGSLPVNYLHTLDNYNDNYYELFIYGEYTIQSFTEITVEDTTIEILSGTIPYVLTNTTDSNAAVSYFLPIDNFISYQDYRATNINLYYTNKEGYRMLIKSFPLSSALANNMAYYNHPSSILFAGHSVIEIPTPKDFTPTHPPYVPSKEIVTNNKVMVSRLNNPFSFAPINTYQIDGIDCKIHALCTSADQITENSFGNHPLIVFTSKGIFALEQGGGNILYSRTVLVDNRIANDNIKTISFNGIIIFICNEQVLALSSRSIAPISTSLDISFDRRESMFTEFPNYINNAELYCLNWYEEIMIYNENYNYAYVYLTRKGAWYTRSLSGKRLSNLTLVTDSGIANLSSKEDNTKFLFPELTTNAICFGDTALTKIEYIRPLYKASKNGVIKLKVYVSNDNLNWHLIANTYFDKRIGRFGSSWRYYKIEFNFSSLSNDSVKYFILSAIEFKYTLRYLNTID